MDSLKQKLEAFQRSRPGLFLKKFQDDQATNLAVLLAWGTLSTLLPLILGILAIGGFVLRDPERLDQLFNQLMAVLPSMAMGPLTEALDNARRSAGSAGLVALVLLLYNGSRFFANMSMVFNQIYHVQPRNFIIQNIVALVMFFIVTALLLLSTVALSLGGLIDRLPIELPFGPTLTRVITWSISIVSGVLVFVLLYKVLPNAKQGWRNVLPGSLVATVLVFLISLLFPLYTALFPPNAAYAIFGIFLVFTFWLYLLGLALVIGAEINAFLQEPARAVALAEAQADAQKGTVDYRAQPGHVRAEAVGTAPSIRPTGPLGAPTPQPHTPRPAVAAESASRPTSFAGKVLGLIGLLLAAVMLRGKAAPRTSQS